MSSTSILDFLLPRPVGPKRRAGCLLFCLTSLVAPTISQTRFEPKYAPRIIRTSLFRAARKYARFHHSTAPADIQRAKERLAALGYWTGPIDEETPEQMRFAILAFQRTIGHKPTGQLTRTEFRVLDHRHRIKPSQKGEGHIEVSLSKQLLYGVDGNGEVHDILPVTTGSRKWFTADGRRRRAVTPRGSFTVYRKIDGWHQSPFGDMYYSSYIVGGVAIHGSRFITNYPRTYGCIGVPLFAAERLSGLMPIGTIVIVHK